MADTAPGSGVAPLSEPRAEPVSASPAAPPRPEVQLAPAPVPAAQFDLATELFSPPEVTPHMTADAPWIREKQVERQQIADLISAQTAMSERGFANVAEKYALSRQAGLPPEMVEGNFEAARGMTPRKFDLDKLERENPVLYKWLKTHPMLGVMSLEDKKINAVTRAIRAMLPEPAPGFLFDTPEARQRAEARAGAEREAAKVPTMDLTQPVFGGRVRLVEPDLALAQAVVTEFDRGQQDVAVSLAVQERILPMVRAGASREQIERELQRAERMRSNAGVQYEYGLSEWGQVAADAARTLASSWDALKGTAVGLGVGGALGGLGGGVVGLAAGGPAGAAAGAIKGSAWGAGFGGAAGGAIRSYKQEAGSAFPEFFRYVGPNGEQADPQVAAGQAVLYGIAAAGVETGVDLFVMLPGVSKLASKIGLGPAVKQAAKELAADASTRTLLKELGISYLRGVAGETGEEAVQQALQNLFGQRVYKQSFGVEGGPSVTDGLADAVSGGLTGALFLGGATSVVDVMANSVGRKMDQVRDAQAGQVLAAVADLADSNVAKTVAAAVAAFIEAESAKAGTEVSTLYVKPEVAKTLFQSQNVDPDAVLGEGAAARVAEAVTTGQPLAIPLREFIERLTTSTGTAQQVLAEMAQNAAARPDGQTLTELSAETAKQAEERLQRAQDLADKYEKEFTAAAGAEAPKRPAGESRLVQAVRDQLADARVYAPKDVSRAVATVQAFLETRAAEFDKDVDELFWNYAIAVESARAGAKARPSAKQIQQLAQRLQTPEAVATAQNSERVATAITETSAPSAAEPRKQESAGSERGSMTVIKGPISASMGKVFRIFLARKADLSTFLHESAHVYLEMLGDLAETPGAPERTKAIYLEVLVWLGVSDRSQLTEAHEEKFAKQYEAYLARGKAPSTRLAVAFEHFRVWLLETYRTLRGLGAELDPYMVSVFDRMLATDAQIDDSLKTMGVDPSAGVDAGLLKDLTPEQRDQYFDLVQDSVSTIRRRVRQKIHEARKAVTESAWRARAKSVAEQVRREVRRSAAQRAYRYLKFDEIHLDGADKPTKAEGGTRLNLALFDAAGGESKAKIAELLGPGRFRKRGGQDVSAVALAHGFDSVESMYKAILDAVANEDEQVLAGTEARMRAEYPSLADDLDQLRQLVLEDAHAPENADWLIRQWWEFRRRAGAGESATVSDDLIAAAKAIASRTIVRPGLAAVALSAERRAAERAAVLAARGDWAAAAVEKQRQLLNYYLWGELRKAEADFAKLQREIDEEQLRKKFAARVVEVRAKSAARIEKLRARHDAERVEGRLAKAVKVAKKLENLADLGLGHPAFRDAIEFILARIGAMRASSEQVPFAKLAEALTLMSAQGRQPAFDQARLMEILMSAVRVDWRGLSVDDMRLVTSAIQQLRRAGLDLYSIRKKEQRLHLNDVVEAAFEETAGLPNLPTPASTTRQTPAVQATIRSLSDFHASFREPLALLRRMGPTISGLISGTFRRAQAERDALIAQMGAELEQAIKDAPASVRDRLKEKLEPDARVAQSSRNPRYRDRSFAILLLANLMTPNNRKRVLEGYGWKLDEVLAWLGETLTPEEAEFTQKIVTLVSERFYDRLADMYERREGLRLRREPAAPVTLRHVDADGNVKVTTYKGGYFPLVRDSVQGEAAFDPKSRGDLLDLGSGWYSVAREVRDGFTKDRVENAEYKVALHGFESLGAHLAKVAHYLSHAEFVDQMTALLGRDDLQGLIKDKFGAAALGNLTRWVPYVASRGDAYSAPDGSEMLMRVLLHMKNTAVWQVLSIGVRVGVADVVTPLLATPKQNGNLKYKYMALAYAEVSKGLATRPRQYLAGLLAKSEALRHRRHHNKSLLRETIELLKARNQWEEHVHDVQEAGYAVLDFSDAVASAVIFRAAELQALGEGKSLQEAVEFANDIVYRVMPSVSREEMGSIYRHRWVAILSPFMTYFSKVWNLYANTLDPYIAAVRASGAGMSRVRTALFSKEAADAAIGMLTIFAIGKVLGEIVSGNKDDDEEIGDFVFRQALTSQTDQIPVIGGGVSSVVNALILDRPISVRASPAASLAQTVYRNFRTLGQKGASGADKTLAALALTTLGASLVLPGKMLPLPSQAVRTLGAIAEGQFSPSNLVFGPDRERRSGGRVGTERAPQERVAPAGR